MGLSTNVKKIHLALGALIDGSYLWAGADKNIANEMQGKDNGDTIYYKRTVLQDVGSEVVTKNSSLTSLSFGGLNQYDTPVGIWDARVGYAVNALDKEICNYGEALALVKVGQKLGKKAVQLAADSDIPRIGNIWVGSNWTAFQTASAYMKSFIDEKLYGWTHWEAWGKLTSQGQQSVPCGLADKRFGHELIGKWNLIDELRSCKFLDKIKGVNLGSATATVTLPTSGDNANKGVLTVTLASGHGGLAKGDTVIFTVTGINQTDTNGEITMPFVFKKTLDSAVTATNSFTIVLEKYDVDFMNGFTTSISSAACTSLISSTASGHYFAPMLFRAEKAQCFGSMNKVTCETAKYEKQSTDGFTIHVNADYDINQLIEKKRFDLVFASKLVEPRAAALVYIDLDA